MPSCNVIKIIFSTMGNDMDLKTKKVKKSKEILFTPEGEVIKKKRGRPKKTV